MDPAVSGDSARRTFEVEIIVDTEPGFARTRGRQQVHDAIRAAGLDIKSVGAGTDGVPVDWQFDLLPG